MENQGDENHVESEIEEISDEFLCCVCLDLLYKPVVIGCGHIACFWCMHKGMNSQLESTCPICRHPTKRFPRICRLMHFLLLRMYPLAYKRRELQVAGEEKASGYASPQFDNYASKSCCQELVVQDPTISPSNSPTGETSLVHDVSKNAKDGGKFMEKNGKQSLLADLTCGICKQLLCCPVVLNCGHVYCRGCVFNQCDKFCRCPVCPLEQPNGYLNTCLVLEHFLEEQVPEEYASRKMKYLGETKMMTANSSLAPNCDDALSSSGPTVHYGVGCDYCGMHPIIGERYKCRDCKEKIGFDLCEACYKNSSSDLLPGRFNQQHTSDHQFDLIQLPLFRALQPFTTGGFFYVSVHDDPFERTEESPSYSPNSPSYTPAEVGYLIFPQDNPTEESYTGSLPSEPPGTQVNSASVENFQNDSRENPSNSVSDNTRGSA
ncbi:unnamed protein product [Cuscuta campestris]|uniref:RING-type domain-containing protein n=1 Tax=Cuscuta campestris TaxID=132261 RepID=A0A484KG81_9ASTE|nr:unnamed protein product [Cuscuta campestris]